VRRIHEIGTPLSTHSYDRSRYALLSFALYSTVSQRCSSNGHRIKIMPNNDGVMGYPFRIDRKLARSI